MDDVINEFEPGYIELARRLEAYADLRLSPSASATTRMRMAVMTAAHRRSALIEADAQFDAAGATTTALAAERAKAAVAARGSWRRPAAAIFAGTLTLAILAGTAYGARPGGPLYGARLWTEMANLPSNLVDRAEAQVARLEDRLHEAQEASTAGDVTGTEAALSAYSTIVSEAARGSGGDPTASAALEVTVTRHVVVLTLMVDSVPGPARSAAEGALSSSTMALDDLDGAGKQTSDRHRTGGSVPGGSIPNSAPAPAVDAGTTSPTTPPSYSGGPVQHDGTSGKPTTGDPAIRFTTPMTPGDEGHVGSDAPDHNTDRDRP